MNSRQGGGESTARSDYMKPEHYNKLFTFMHYENTLAARVSLETGMRIGDVVQLRPEQLHKRTITYTADKTGKAGKAVITQDLANRLRAISGTAYIFEKRGDPEGHRTRQTVWKDVTRAAEALRAAGIIGDANITPHSARKTFAVEDAEKHGIRHTQKLLQHSSVDTTKMYVFSEKYLDAMTDNYVLKALIRQVANLSDQMEQILLLLASFGNCSIQKKQNDNSLNSELDNLNTKSVECEQK